MKQRSAVMFKVIAFFFVACIDTCLYGSYYITGDERG